jgi:inorganic pyrophosphatase
MCSPKTAFFRKVFAMSFPKSFYRWRPHPWHGLDIGEKAPDVVNAYIEMTPFDAVKYEVDKTTGYLLVDRPQLTSSMPPTLYGFIPHTYCGVRVQKLSPTSTRGDGDPLDICVITERPINRGEVLLHARVIGGVQMIDHSEADDKIIAVLHEDQFWSHVNSVDQVPQALRDRLWHYFETYKQPAGGTADVSVVEIYGADHAKKVIQAAQADYDETYGG